MTFVQQIAASGHLLYRHTHSYYYAQRIVVPSRTLWQWNTVFYVELNLKEILPALVIQLVNNVFHSDFPAAARFYNDPTI